MFISGPTHTPYIPKLEDPEDICLKLAELGNFTEAVKLAKTIDCKISKLVALQSIAFEAGNQKQWDLAKTMANSISDIGIRKNILLDLVGKLCNEAEFGQAELMAYTLIVPDEVRSEARRVLSAARLDWDSKYSKYT